jgi:hypothetical protein
MGHMLHVSIPDACKVAEIIGVLQGSVAMIVQEFLEVVLRDPHEPPKPVRHQITGLD